MLVLVTGLVLVLVLVLVWSVRRGQSIRAGSTAVQETIFMHPVG